VLLELGADLKKTSTEGDGVLQVAVFEGICSS
jgi:hypothetical protein